MISEELAAAEEAKKLIDILDIEFWFEGVIP